jgi:dolichol-phosphate mannosyltransferase
MPGIDGRSASNTTTPAPAGAGELLVVMPVFNEEASIGRVVREWHAELSRHAPDFRLLVINDGSTDATNQRLMELQGELGLQLEVMRRENRGHGQTCLQGYRLAVERQCAWVLQLDSDGQCDPRYFHLFWEQRDQFDVIYGKRVWRDDGWQRSVASWVLKLVVLACSRAWCCDPNVPFRLMRTEILPAALATIPADFFLGNVALAVLLKRAGKFRHGCVPIRFRNRYGGQSKVRLPQFGFRARQLVKQLRELERAHGLAQIAPESSLLQ